MSMNRMANSKNQYQGDYKRVLCVCSAGLLRSPTAAVVLAQEPFNYNTRAVGVSHEYALTPIEATHIFWADEIVCVSGEVAFQVKAFMEKHEMEDIAKVITLDIPDSFRYRDPRLIEIIKEQYLAATTKEVKDDIATA